MASNSFGKIFRITTFGESHGRAVGVVIDGCPAGLELSEHDINLALQRRAPGRTAYTSPRYEEDLAEILSGIFEGKTTGAPICILIPNKNADSSKYEPLKNLLRPGHANYPYLEKYGIFDYRGGGRSSARETVCRVAAGAVAQKLLKSAHIETHAYLTQIGTEKIDLNDFSQADLEDLIRESPVFCPDLEGSQRFCRAIEAAQQSGDSLGGIVSFIATGVLPGFGDPVYEKLEANLAQAMLSLPASKGFEIGSGFQAAAMMGSEHNDRFFKQGDRVCTATNHSGGILGGISNGMPIFGCVGFKPTSSVQKQQQTCTISGEPAILELPEGSRHDPCVAIRAVPVVEAMLNLVLIDALLMDRCAKW